MTVQGGAGGGAVPLQPLLPRDREPAAGVVPLLREPEDLPVQPRVLRPHVRQPRHRSRPPRHL